MHITTYLFINFFFEIFGSHKVCIKYIANTCMVSHCLFFLNTKIAEIIYSQPSSFAKNP